MINESFDNYIAKCFICKENHLVFIDANSTDAETIPDGRCLECLKIELT